MCLTPLHPSLSSAPTKPVSLPVIPSRCDNCNGRVPLVKRSSSFSLKPVQTGVKWTPMQNMMLICTSMMSRRDAIRNRVLGAKLFEIIIRMPTVAISLFGVLDWNRIPATSSTVATVWPFAAVYTAVSINSWSLTESLFCHGSILPFGNIPTDTSVPFVSSVLSPFFELPPHVLALILIAIPWSWLLNLNIKNKNWDEKDVYLLHNNDISKI